MIVLAEIGSISLNMLALALWSLVLAYLAAPYWPGLCS